MTMASRLGAAGIGMQQYLQSLGAVSRVGLASLQQLPVHREAITGILTGKTGEHALQIIGQLFHRATHSAIFRLTVASPIPVKLLRNLLNINNLQPPPH